jgi:hypothetical protein
MAEQRIPGQAKPEKRPPFGAASDKRAAPEAPPLSPDKRIGFAVVGLGRLGLEEIIPAFGVCKLAKLSISSCVVHCPRDTVRRISDKGFDREIGLGAVVGRHRRRLQCRVPDGVMLMPKRLGSAMFTTSS